MYQSNYTTSGLKPVDLTANHTFSMAVVAFIFGYADTAGLDHLLTTIARNV
jgi:hypothetical protein